LSTPHIHTHTYTHTHTRISTHIHIYTHIKSCAHPQWTTTGCLYNTQVLGVSTSKSSQSRTSYPQETVPCLTDDGVGTQNHTYSCVQSGEVLYLSYKSFALIISSSARMFTVHYTVKIEVIPKHLYFSKNKGDVTAAPTSTRRCYIHTHWVSLFVSTLNDISCRWNPQLKVSLVATL